MNFKDRIGVDLGRRAKIEDGLQAAVDNRIHYLDVKIDVAPNAIETLTPERIKHIRDTCEANDIHIGVHTMSAVNMAEIAPHVRDGVDAYIKGHMDACKKIGGEWIVVHAGYHFTSDIPLRQEAGLERLKKFSDYGEKIGLTLLLENMNWEPDDAEVHYLAHNLEECHYYFSRLDSPNLRWAFTVNHAHLVPEGIDGFIDAMDMARCDEVRLADCFGDKEVHLYPGEGNIDFGHAFKRIEETGFKGHYMNAFCSLEEMVSARDYLADRAREAGVS